MMPEHRKTMTAYLRLMRVDRLIGFELLLWPTLWALCLAWHGAPPWHLLAIFIAGCFVTRALGCILNDLTDQALDRHVARTAHRPLACNRLSRRQASGLAGILALIALALALCLNWTCILIATCSIPLMILYPYCKRWIPCPQFVLGVVFNLGILMAFASYNQQLPLSAWWLFACAWLWTIIYDTIYALADRKDDLRIGIRSTAIWFGRYDRVILAGLHVVLLLSLTGFGIYNLFTWEYFIVLAACAALFMYQHWLIRARNPIQCSIAFRNNHWIGIALLIGILASMPF